MRNVKDGARQPPNTAGAVFKPLLLSLILGASGCALSGAPVDLHLKAPPHPAASWHLVLQPVDAHGRLLKPPAKNEGREGRFDSPMEEWSGNGCFRMQGGWPDHQFSEVVTPHGIKDHFSLLTGKPGSVVCIRPLDGWDRARLKPRREERFWRKQWLSEGVDPTVAGTSKVLGRNCTILMGPDRSFGADTLFLTLDNATGVCLAGETTKHGGVQSRQIATVFQTGIVLPSKLFNVKPKAGSPVLYGPVWKSGAFYDPATLKPLTDTLTMLSKNSGMWLHGVPGSKYHFTLAAILLKPLVPSYLPAGYKLLWAIVARREFKRNLLGDVNGAVGSSIEEDFLQPRTGDSIIFWQDVHGKKAGKGAAVEINGANGVLQHFRQPYPYTVLSWHGQGRDCRLMCSRLSDAQVLKVASGLREERFPAPCHTVGN